MTDNIVKLYELAGIKPTTIGCTNEDIQSPEFYSNDCEGDCIDCSWYDEDEEYPPFTAEKQLELIKLLAFEKRFSLKYINAKWNFYNGEWGVNSTIKYEPFEQALAGLVCELWEYLTDEQREEIKRILE